MPYWSVRVTNGAGTKGDLVPVEADTEAEARRIALEVTPGNIDEVVRCEQITHAEFTALSTPAVIPPPEK